MAADSWLQPDWIAPPGVHALCTCRYGGVSLAPYDTFNMGAHVGDAPLSVQRNRERVQEQALLPGEPRWLSQRHGIAVADLDAADAAVPVADAAVTTRANVVCAVLTADCLPVLLSTVDGSAVGVVHAGWRGLAAGVIETALASLRLKAPQAGIRAWLGPAIGPAHFEVGPDVRAAFVHHDAAAEQAFVPGPQSGEQPRWQCDLYLLARQRLHALGVHDVAGGGLCTYADGARFFSHRRDVQHRGLTGTGRMASLIWRGMNASA